jgi:hypothetical protein
MNRPLFVALVNRVPYLKGRRADVVERMARAVSLQIEQDFAPAWGFQPVPIAVVEDGAGVPFGSALVYLVDRISEGKGAVGLHVADPAGYFAGYVAVEVIQRLGGSMTEGADSVSAALSHEVLELLANPALNLWAETCDGRLIAHEVCDPVSGDAYDIEVEPDSVGAPHRVSVSNFVRPSWFHREACSGSWFDQMQLTTQPFEVRATGYAVERGRVGLAPSFGGAIAVQRRDFAADGDRLSRQKRGTGDPFA